MSETLKSVSVKSLVQSGVITAISRLKFNKSGYPFVTFLQGNKPNSVYFGRKTAILVEGTFKQEDNIIPFLKNAEVIQTENENGEIRYKLSTSDSSKYSSRTELADVFGLEETVTNFDMELFNKEFGYAESIVPTEESAV